MYKPSASRHRGLFFASVALMLAMVIAAWPQATASSSELPDGAMKEKAETACTECHEARIIVQQRLSKAAWTKEVDKMVKWGAVVEPADHDPLVDYLSTNFSPDKPPYEPGRTQASHSPPNSKEKK